MRGATATTNLLHDKLLDFGVGQSGTAMHQDQMLIVTTSVIGGVLALLLLLGVSKTIHERRQEQQRQQALLRAGRRSRELDMPPENQPKPAGYRPPQYTTSSVENASRQLRKWVSPVKSSNKEDVARDQQRYVVGHWSISSVEEILDSVVAGLVDDQEKNDASTISFYNGFSMATVVASYTKDGKGITYYRIRRIGDRFHFFVGPGGVNI